MKKHCILIIDDDPNQRKTLVDILKARGYETLAAEDGAAGIDLLRNNSVNLVLTDLGLPDISGVEILAVVKAERPQTQTIILTGGATLDSAIEASNRGAFSYLLKPYNVDYLLLNIQRAIEKQQVEEELRLSRHMLEDITQGITESILLISPDYKILWANKATLLQTGLTMDEIIGNYCYRVNHQRDLPCAAFDTQCPLDGLLATGISKTIQHLHCDKDGNKIFMEINAYPIKDDTGMVTGLVYVSRDITERVRMQAEIADKVIKLEASLARVKRLEGIIPICIYCKKIQDDTDKWQQMEVYISQHSDAVFNHGICAECYKKQLSELEPLKNS